jgi:thymidylate synthase (FAD)
MRQWIRHRIGSFNEKSGRYTEFEDNDYYVPEKWRAQDSTNKQGSIESEFGNKCIGMDSKSAGTCSHWQTSPFGAYIHSIETSFEIYKKLLDVGIAKEMARMVLPSSVYTQFYWNVNLRSLMNFLKLRLDKHAQWEIQEYARAVLKIVREIIPWSIELLENDIN